jgi:hypothetical protein
LKIFLNKKGMPQIFPQYQLTIDQAEGGWGNGRTTQIFCEIFEEGFLELSFCILGRGF